MFLNGFFFFLHLFQCRAVDVEKINASHNKRPWVRSARPPRLQNCPISAPLGSPGRGGSAGAGVNSAGPQAGRSSSECGRFTWKATSNLSFRVRVAGLTPSAQPHCITTRSSAECAGKKHRRASNFALVQLLLTNYCPIGAKSAPSVCVKLNRSLEITDHGVIRNQQYDQCGFISRRGAGQHRSPAGISVRLRR